MQHPPPPCQFSPNPSPRTPKRKLPLHSDGFAWVKYGEKRLSPSGLLREYYKCRSWRPSHSGGTGCSAKKVVDRPYSDIFTEDGLRKNQAKESLALIFFKDSTEAHNHPPPSATDLSAPPTPRGSAPPTPNGACPGPGFNSSPCNSNWNSSFMDLVSGTAWPSGCQPSPAGTPHGLPPRCPQLSPSGPLPPSPPLGQNPDVAAVSEMLVRNLLGGVPFGSWGEKADVQNQLREALIQAAQNLKAGGTTQHCDNNVRSCSNTQPDSQSSWQSQELQRKRQHQQTQGQQLQQQLLDAMASPHQQQQQQQQQQQSPPLGPVNPGRFKPALPPLMIPEPAMQGPESVHDTEKPEAQFPLEQGQVGEEVQEPLDLPLDNACDFLFDIEDLGSATKASKMEGVTSAESMVEGSGTVDPTAAEGSPSGSLKRKECSSPMEGSSADERLARLLSANSRVSTSSREDCDPGSGAVTGLLSLLEGLTVPQMAPANPCVIDRPASVTPAQSHLIGALTALLGNQCQPVVQPVKPGPEAALLNLIVSLCKGGGDGVKGATAAESMDGGLSGRSSDYFSAACGVSGMWRPGGPKSWNSTGKESEGSLKLQTLLKALGTGSNVQELVNAVSGVVERDDESISTAHAPGNFGSFQKMMEEPQKSMHSENTMQQVLCTLVAAASGKRFPKQESSWGTGRSEGSVQQVLFQALLMSLGH